MNTKHHELIEILPTNLAERFFMLESANLTRLSHDEVSDAVDSYKYFLWLYHLSQFNFREKGIGVAEFDVPEVTERIASLDNILKREIFRY